MSAHITELDITRLRGDNFPVQFTLTDEDGVAVDIAGFAFNWVVDVTEEPTDITTQVFKLTGVLVDEPGGVFEFQPSEAQMDLDPNTDYFHEVSMVDAGAFKRTIVRGKLIMEQDKDKS